MSKARAKHSIAVAEKMRDIVIRNPSLCDCTPEEAYALGHLHDIGYAFVDDPDKHATYAGELLENAGYKHWREVYWHGNPTCIYKSKELYLLNYADMTTSSSGKNVTFQRRINDIAKRYGDNSMQVRSACAMIERLRSFCSRNNLDC